MKFSEKLMAELYSQPSLLISIVLQQVTEAAVANGRKVAVFGRSMEAAIQIGQDLGYIHAPKDTFIDAGQVNRLPANQVTILCTGSQGEPMAALI